MSNGGTQINELINSTQLQSKEALFIPDAGHNNLFEFNIDEKLFTFLEKQKNLTN